MTRATRPYRMEERARAVERTRERILSAARARFTALPYDEVRLADVAASAGVTQQTLRNHFTSKEGLFLALVAALAPEIEALRGPVSPGDVPGAVAALLRQYEALGDANVRLVAAAERIPVVARGVEFGRAAHAAWLEEVFAGALPAEPRSRARAVAALYAVSDVGTWKLLRRDLGLGRSDVAAVLEVLLRAALEAAPAP
ncbi:TetR/AcrR family transcriptional regulator [Geodermatophilus sp. SYSU D00758]